MGQIGASEEVCGTLYGECYGIVGGGVIVFSNHVGPWKVGWCLYRQVRVVEIKVTRLKNILHRKFETATIYWFDYPLSWFSEGYRVLAVTDGYLRWEITALGTHFGIPQQDLESPGVQSESQARSGRKVRNLQKPTGAFYSRA